MFQKGKNARNRRFIRQLMEKASLMIFETVSYILVYVSKIYLAAARCTAFFFRNVVIHRKRRASPAGDPAAFSERYSPIYRLY